MIKRIKQSEFIGSVATLASGTVIGHLAAILFSPIITRLYTAEEMSYQSVLLGLYFFFQLSQQLDLNLLLPYQNEWNMLIRYFVFQ